MRRSRITLVSAIIALAAVAAAGPAAADAPGESDESAQLVRQAIALIVNTPGDMEGIEDKIVDAREAPKQGGVDLDLVGEAEEAFQRGDMHEVRALLERSVGAQPHPGAAEPLPIRQTRGQPGMPMATAAESGTDVAADPLAADRDRSGGDWLALAGLAALTGAGVWLAVRFRPPPHARGGPPVSTNQPRPGRGVA